LLLVADFCDILFENLEIGNGFFSVNSNKLFGNRWNRFNLLSLLKAIYGIVVSYINMILVTNNLEYIFFLDILNIAFFIKFMKNFEFSFTNQLLDFTLFDNLEFQWRKMRFKLFYGILSSFNNLRVYVLGHVGFFQPLFSIINLFGIATWLEREVFDMYGIFFSFNIDLRRILSDYGFYGNPLKKDFPLMGFVEIRYDNNLKYIVVEPIELSQEFRNFKYDFSWKQINY